MDQDKMERVSAAAARALQERAHASLNDVLAAMGHRRLERSAARQFLDRLVAKGAIVRIATDLYAPVRARPQLPGRSYVSGLADLPMQRLMGARA